ncbi:DUF1405 domain-containing protein [Caldalkalibacillus thermarum]|uniref:DUF1405 domain-containing protein n=1 Tax=Caldalkalibacillus thermarum TaxID=296745 RepID=UPI001FD28F57|nr:DUF1405 domain-containing protein [Caldalkalibacillus thermarum]
MGESDYTYSHCTKAGEGLIDESSRIQVGFILGRKWKLLEAFAAVTLFKYGIWATVMIIWTGLLGGEVNWQHYMLIVSV